MPPPCPLSRVILLYCFESSTREPNATSICARQLSSAEIIIFPNSAFFFINDERDAPLKYHVSSPFQLGNSRENASLYPAVLKYICAYARRHCTQAISHVLWMFFYVFFIFAISRAPSHYYPKLPFSPVARFSPVPPFVCAVKRNAENGPTGSKGEVKYAETKAHRS